MVKSTGLVSAMHCVVAGGTDPDPDLAFQIVERCVEKGLLLFAPVGFKGASIKIAPPLIITKEQLADGLAALSEAFDEILNGN